jgi:L-alanine-DL-glutamate epimerase-like enolase superfamily enzyme
MGMTGDGSVEGLLNLLREVFLGRRIDEFLEVSDGRVVRPKKAANRAFRSNGWMSILAYDLLGREMGVSCVELLGGRIRDRVDAYDTTLYFHDLRVPEKGVAQLTEEASEAVRAGWRQLKIKTGRGGRWMAPEAGARRDVEVVLAVRDAVGPEVKILVDANFGYDGRLDLLEQFIRETQPADVFWLEEMVTASVDDYRVIRDIQDRVGSEALLVCGEVDRDPISYVYLDLIEDGLIDGYQPDIVSQGFSRFKEIEHQLEGTGVRALPHCFHNGNFGTRAALIYGASSEGFITIEDERSAPSVYKPDAFTFENGSYNVADTPGLGLEVDEDLFQSRYAQNEAKISD